MDLDWGTFAKLAADETAQMESSPSRYELSDWGRFGWPVPLAAATEVFWKALSKLEQEQLINDLLMRKLLEIQVDPPGDDEFSRRYAYGTEIANLFYRQSMGNSVTANMSTGTQGQATVD